MRSLVPGQILCVFFQACAFAAQTWLAAGASWALKGVVVKALGTLAYHVLEHSCLVAPGASIGGYLVRSLG